MAVLTIYNHGSGGWSGKSASTVEIVNMFGNAHAGYIAGGVVPYKVDGTNQPFIITEGVGGKGDPHQHHITFDKASNQLQSSQDAAPRGPFSKKRASLRRAKENALGLGVQENVDNVKEIVGYLVANNQAPSAINMIGWSRGAVTCIRIASELWRDGDVGASQIPVRIFAVDPVAGGGADSAEKDKMATQGNVLYPNVTHFFDILSLDENRNTFSPKSQSKLQIADGARTHSAYLHFPGVHSDVAKWSSEPGFVVFDLCARFLNYFGTHIPEHQHFLMTTDRLIQCYFNMALGRKSTGLIVSSRKNDKTTFGQKKWRDGQSGIKQRLIGQGFSKRGNLSVDQVSGDGDDVFVNFHHEQLFRTHYSNLYNICFNSTLPPFEFLSSIGNPSNQTQLDKLDMLSPGTADLLSRTNRSVTRADETTWAGLIAGCGMLA